MSRSVSSDETADTEDLWHGVNDKMRRRADEHDLDPEATARAWRLFVRQLGTGSVKRGIRQCETMAEVRAWVAVYNTLEWQLPPKYEGIIETIAEQADTIREEQRRC